MQSLHRVRARLVGQRTALLVRQRTALMNAARGHMAEFGIIVPQGRRHIGELISLTLGEDDVLPTLAREALHEVSATLEALDRRIAKAESVIPSWHRRNASSRRLAAIAGMGPITASALAAAVGNGRQLAAHASSRPGSASCRGRTVLVASSARVESPNRGIDISAAYWWWALLR